MCCTMPGSDTGFAMLQVHVLAGVFNSAHATALAWVHLLLLDLVQARSVDISQQKLAESFKGHAVCLILLAVLSNCAKVVLAVMALHLFERSVRPGHDGAVGNAAGRCGWMG